MIRVVATRQEMYKNLVGQMTVLNPHNYVHENPRLGEDEVKNLCKTFHLNNQVIHLALQVLEKAFLINSTSCLWRLTVDTIIKQCRL